MNNSEITFFKSLGDYGLRRFIKSFSLYVSFIAAGIYWYFDINKQVCPSQHASLSILLIGTAAGLFSILFAAFAIIIALSDKEFLLLLRKMGKLKDILFPFWLVSFCYLISIIVNIVASLNDGRFGAYASVLGVFLFSFSLAETFYLVTTTVKFGLYRAEIYGLLAEQSEINRQQVEETD